MRILVGCNIKGPDGERRLEPGDDISPDDPAVPALMELGAVASTTDEAPPQPDAEPATVTTRKKQKG